MFVKDKMLIKYALKIRPSLYNHRYISIYGAVNSHHGSKDYYKVLDIKKNSSRKDIKLAYYKLSKKYHPDVSEITESEEKYKDIQEAYHVLGDERRKADYDEAINNGYYSGPSSASSVSRDSPYRAAWKKRTGPIYSGRKR